MKNIAEKFIRFSAVLSLVIGIVSSIFILLLAILLFSSVEGINLGKLFVMIFVAIVLIVVIFFFFFGIYEFLRYFLKIEREVEILEKEAGVYPKDRDYDGLK